MTCKSVRWEAIIETTGKNQLDNGRFPIQALMNNKVKWPLLAAALVLVASCAGAQKVTPFYTFPLEPMGIMPSAGLTLGSDGNFYGTASFAGSNGSGTVFKMTPQGGMTLLHGFEGTDGWLVEAPVVEGSDGNFYGTTVSGGASISSLESSAGFGTIYKVSSNGCFTSLYSFTNGVDGSGIYAPLVEGDDGDFYGTAARGGTGNHGTIFKISPEGSFFSLYSFTNGYDGTTPQAGLVEGKDGNFYGTVGQGGTNGYGTIFQITPAGVLTSLYSFTNGVDGSTPLSLAEGDDGNFYGTAYEGGTNGFGTVFKVTPAGAFSSLYSFQNGSDGAYPVAALALGNDGSFYGTATGGGNSGGGTMFKITTAGVFTSFYDGGANALALGNDGNFYGTTFEGGNNNGYYTLGTVFKITTEGDFTLLYAFPYQNDYMIPDAIIQGSDGNLYGTYNGYSGISDAVFKLSLDGAFTLLYSFTNSFYGSKPLAALAEGSDGNYYGTTQSGGSNNSGTIYVITPGGNFRSLYSFTNGVDGSWPNSLVQGDDGNFYGTCLQGGVDENGTVFKISPDGLLTSLYSFTNGVDGATPSGGLIEGSNGNFFGTCQNGGVNGDGTVFEISSGGLLASLHSFTGGADGGSPFGGLVAGPDGTFYGTTWLGGGFGGGTVFNISPAGILTTIYSFNGGSVGYSPNTPLALGSDGNFYGTTGGGIGGFDGAIFKVSPAGDLASLYEFDVFDEFSFGSLGGAFAALVPASDGNLYGVSSGGPDLSGSIYKINLASSLQAPVITTQPQNQTIALGGTASFSVTAPGAKPLSYQWQFDGANIAGTMTNLIVANVQSSNAGYYTVVVSNCYGAITSAVASLSIPNVAPAFVNVPGANYYSNGSFVMQLTNLTGQGPIIVYGSTNLFQWTPILTNPPAYSLLQIVDSNAGNFPRRFYSVGSP
jgi:uncharacterized repeat protein (TIGR03803 family)